MYKVYNVLEGETLESIAKKFGTDVNTLQKINEVNSVYPGISIIVPNVREVEYFTIYIVKKGDNLYEISKKYNINIDLLRSINGLEKDEYLYPDQELLIPKEDVELHVVKEGETLQDISKKLGANPISLVESNETIYLLPEQLVVYKKKENI